MKRKHILIPALAAAVLAGCSGGDPAPGASGQPTVLAATLGSITSYSSVKFGGGGYVTGLIYHPTSANVQYARTDIGGAYRWNQANASWTPITDGLGFGGGESTYHGVESMAVDPTNDQRVYMVTGMYTKDGGGGTSNGRFYASSDRGTTWTHYDLPFPVGGNEDARAIGERLKLDPTNPSTMFYGARTAGLWRSTDSGHTWSQLTGLSTTILTGAQLQAMGHVAGVEQIMFDNSAVGGGTTTWIMYAAIAPDYANAAGLSSTLYRSDNGGYSWTPVAVPAAVSGYYIPHMVRTTDGNYYVAFNKSAGQGAGGPGYLYKFGGVVFNQAWTLLSSNSAAGYGGVSVYGNGATARIALAVTGTWGSGQVVQLSDNGGSTWREIEQGMPHSGGTTAGGWVDDIEIDPTNRDHISHIHGGGIVETRNASSATPSWAPSIVGIEETATLSVNTPPAGASYKFINNAGDVGTWVQTDPTVAPTRNPGRGWSQGYASDMAWSDPGYIANEGTINSTKTAYGSWSGDSGNTWSSFATLPAGAQANQHASATSIAVTSRNNVIWAPANSVPSYTTNNGASWIATNLPAPAAPGWDNGYHVVADRKNASKVYAYDSGGAFWGTAGKVYVSTDGGHTFTLSQGSVSANLAPNGYGITAMAVNPNVEGDLWLADGEALYHSTNSGASWTKLTGFASVAANGSQYKMLGASMLALGKAQAGASYSAALYVVGTRNGVWALYHSDDGGASWARYNDDNHQYGEIGVMAGDWNTYGRIYFSGTGRGLLYSN